MAQNKRNHSDDGVDVVSDKRIHSDKDDIESVDGNDLDSSASNQNRSNEEIPVHKPSTGPSGLFLDTINRGRLEFDFEKVCSVSLSNLNVYACLVCGKYYKGEGQ